MEQRVVVISGVLNGIGLEVIQAYLGADYKVVFWGKVDEAYLHLIDKERLEFLNVNMSDLKEVEQAGEFTLKKYKRIDILINHSQKNAWDNSLSSQHDIEQNLTAVFNVIKVVAPMMLRQKFGRIINTASLVNQYQNLEQTSLDATKSGLQGIARVWTRQLLKHGITINTVYTGFVEPEPQEQVSKSLLQNLCSKIPAGRLANRKEIVELYQFLASEKAAYISGTNIYIDGGYFS